MTLPIILAAAGCLALLAGLFGGGFKAKEVEVPKISLWPRIFSSVIGLGLVAAAIFAYFYAPSATSPSVPTPATTPVPDPETFVRSYFDSLWQNRNYDFLWNNDLTAKFQSYAAPKGFQDYTQNWDKVQKIDINSVSVSRQSETRASVVANLTFYYKNGNISANNSISYDLTYNPSLATWQFDVH
jgi:hypothetical protein